MKGRGSGIGGVGSCYGTSKKARTTAETKWMCFSKRGNRISQNIIGNQFRIFQPIRFGCTFKSTKLFLYIYFIGNDDGTGWKELCTSCEVESSPSEKYVGKKTLIDCKQSCKEEAVCTGVDYGKGSRSMECFHNYGGKQSHTTNSDFDAYIFKGYRLNN